jgi:hypothetical protein
MPGGEDQQPSEMRAQQASRMAVAHHAQAASVSRMRLT